MTRVGTVLGLVAGVIILVLLAMIVSRGDQCRRLCQDRFPEQRIQSQARYDGCDCYVHRVKIQWEDSR